LREQQQAYVNEAAMPMSACPIELEARLTGLRCWPQMARQFERK
jgi:hypothetical protein